MLLLMLMFILFLWQSFCHYVDVVSKHKQCFWIMIIKTAGGGIA